MPTTPNLGILHLQPQQDSPDIVVNVALDIMDGALTGLMTLTVTSADVDLTSADNTKLLARTFFIRVIGALTGNRNLIVPAKAKPLAVSHEGTGNHTLTIKTASGTGVSLDQGTVAFVYSDATNVVPITAAVGAGGQPYDHGIRREGIPANGEVLYELTAVRNFRLPANLAGSAGKKAGVTATATATFHVKKNGVQVGTVVYPNTNSFPTFTMASDTDFLASGPDLLSVEAPSPQDATLADVQFTLKGTRF